MHRSGTIHDFAIVCNVDAGRVADEIENIAQARIVEADVQRFARRGIENRLGGSGAGRIRAAYGQSIQYTLNSMISFVQRYRDPNLVVIMLGDHQPWSIVSGQGASHDVPISVIAHDPKVLSRISGWGWNNGLQPSPRAPV